MTAFIATISHYEMSTLVDWLMLIVHRLQSSVMTNEEHTLPKLTHRQLKTLPNWEVWDAMCNKQLDAHHTASAFLKPIPHPPQLPGV